MRYLFSIFVSILFFINVTAQSVRSIADSNNLFALNLYSELSKQEPGNLFFSPFSISTALAMTYAGARNEAEKQMRDVLHFSLAQDSFHTQYKNYLDKIVSDSDNNLTIQMANGIWSSITLLPPFTKIVQNDYHSELRKADFVAHREEADQEINIWVEHKTNNKIQNIIHLGDIGRGSKLVLINAIYFKGKWNIPFSKDSTRKGNFYTSRNDSDEAKFMHNTAYYRYYEDSIIQAIQLNYAGEKVSMLLLLPKEKNGIAKVEQQLDNTYYSTILASMRFCKVVLSIPKISPPSYSLDLRKALWGMGMPDAFQTADFSGLADGGLSIDHVIHKAFVDIDEEGTEAAAATAIIMKMTAVGPSPGKYAFIANHSFILIIKDNATGSILFMGNIIIPTMRQGSTE